MTEVSGKIHLPSSSLHIEDTSRARKCIENWKDLLYAISKMKMCRTLFEPHIDIRQYVKEVEEIGRATIDQLGIALTTESVKGVSKEHQDAIIDEAEKTYRLANTHKLGSVLSQYHVREMSFAHYSYRLRQGDAALLEIWELLNWHHEGWERKQKRCLMRHLTAALKASPVSSFGVGGTSESFDVSGGIYERYVHGREYASRAIGALVYARSVTAVNDITKSSLIIDGPAWVNESKHRNEDNEAEKHQEEDSEGECSWNDLEKEVERMLRPHAPACQRQSTSASTAAISTTTLAV